MRDSDRFDKADRSASVRRQQSKFHAAGLALAAALALAGPAPAQAAQKEPHTILHLTQSAERNVVRDRLRIELRIEKSGLNPEGVQSAINTRMAAALEAARQVKAVEVETGVYRVGEERPKQGAVEWHGSQSLILTGTDASAMLTLAGKLQSDGLVMSSLAYEISREAVRGAETDLTDEALAGLHRRTAAIADRLHLSVLRYRDLKVGNAESGPPPIRYGALQAAAMAAPVAAPGEATIRVTITADVILGPPTPSETR